MISKTFRLPSGQTKFEVELVNRLNSILKEIVDNLSPYSLPTYANNAAALAGGLVAGELYKTATGTVMVVYTP